MYSIVLSCRLPWDSQRRRGTSNSSWYGGAPAGRDVLRQRPFRLAELFATRVRVTRSACPGRSAMPAAAAASEESNAGSMKSEVGVMPARRVPSSNFAAAFRRICPATVRRRPRKREPFSQTLFPIRQARELQNSSPRGRARAKAARAGVRRPSHSLRANGNLPFD